MTQIKGDPVQKFLESNCIEVVTDESGWEKLYLNKSTNEFWILTFHDSHLHGGGIPQLTLISNSDAEAKFKLPGKIKI